MRSRIIALLATVVLLLAYATTALAGRSIAATQGFPDDPGVSAAVE